mmetsp:Transcript_36860/g.91768  ORF Transcript_36860/g.91768 Transcript_36860/m.91768 type:complete len:216 (-) Transcript_36860:2402-3049(-)
MCRKMLKTKRIMESTPSVRRCGTEWLAAGSRCWMTRGHVSCQRETLASAASTKDLSAKARAGVAMRDPGGGARGRAVASCARACSACVARAPIMATNAWSGSKALLANTECNAAAKIVNSCLNEWAPIRPPPAATTTPVTEPAPEAEVSALAEAEGMSEPTSPSATATRASSCAQVFNTCVHWSTPRVAPSACTIANSCFSASTCFTASNACGAV